MDKIIALHKTVEIFESLRRQLTKPAAGANATMAVLDAAYQKWRE